MNNKESRVSEILYILLTRLKELGMSAKIGDRPQIYLKLNLYYYFHLLIMIRMLVCYLV